ncbi:Trehalose synthase [hydrothermal vent metagenome]|uniref:Trehalose synthase n=1 Tax=hydrothermal vent metagenome TaxID=652676 RepID=A0A3B0VI35_9ZZZZ
MINGKLLIVRGKRPFLFLLLLLILAACQKTAPATPTATAVPLPTSTPLPEPTATPNPLIQGSNGYPWWNDVVFYEIFVRSFYDSDGDGIGDLNGVIEKLDYLNDGDPSTSDDLGVTGIWLMPIMVSPSYHGYDVVDYFQIDPDYGTNEDFARLMEEAHARGIRVIVDLVMNHTSSQNPWFVEAKNPDSDKRDWYVWEDENPSYRGPWGQSVWHSTPNGYYYAVFWGGMPDLNYENPEVTAAMYEIIQFWLEEMDVDGFRLDGVKHMVEDGRIQENSLATHAWLKDFYTFYKGINANALTVGEAWTGTQQVVDYTGDEVDIAFQFDLALDILNGADAGLGVIFSKTQQEVVDSFPANQYATFITNHDQNRVMSQLDGDEAKARLAASLLLTAPGVPFIYYGEEIGQAGTKPDEDIRLPMQWASNGPKVGFTEGTPWRPAAADFPVRSVQRQEDDPNSLLTHYRTLIQLRNEHEALRVGDWILVEANSARLYTFLRQTEGETILVIINLNRNPVTAANYSLELAGGVLDGSVTAVSLFGNSVTAAPEINSDGSFSGYTPFDEISAQSTHIIQLQSEK